MGIRKGQSENALVTALGVGLGDFEGRKNQGEQARKDV